MSYKGFLAYSVLLHVMKTDNLFFHVLCLISFGVLSTHGLDSQ